MFCGFCEQPTNGLCYIESFDIQAYGQISDIKEIRYYCDFACASASIRNKEDPEIRILISKTEELVAEIKAEIKLKKSLYCGEGKKEANKEDLVFAIAMRSLSIFLKACLERRTREELKTLLEEAKRLFHEAFAYERYINVLSRMNSGYLQERLLNVWAK